MSLRPKFPSFAPFAIVLVALGASSCGLKGPLYVPDEQQSEAVAPAEDAAGAKKKTGESSVQPPVIDPDRPAVPPGR